MSVDLDEACVQRMVPGMILLSIPRQISMVVGGGHYRLAVPGPVQGTDGSGCKGALKDSAGTRLARTGCKAFCIRTQHAVETFNVRCPVPLETCMYPDVGSTLKKKLVRMMVISSGVMRLLL